MSNRGMPGSIRSAPMRSLIRATAIASAVAAIMTMTVAVSAPARAQPLIAAGNSPILVSSAVLPRRHGLRAGIGRARGAAAWPGIGTVGPGMVGNLPGHIVGGVPTGPQYPTYGNQYPTYGNQYPGH
jgi:hypothetical protein